MKNLLIVDIGGTNTRLRVMDISENILWESVSGGVATAADSTFPIPSLENQLSEMPDKENIGAISINLGGKNTEQVKLCFGKFFPDTLGEEYGAPIVLMAGTGAIAVGKSDNGFVITGGWGINIGDDGSGYDIGLQAIRMSLRALDNTQGLSPLTQFLCDCTEPLLATAEPAPYRDGRDMVRQRLFPLDRQHIASFAKIVADFAERGV